MDLPETKILQKRVFRPGGDTPEDRYAYVPERPGGESAPVRDEHLDESMEALNGFKDEIMDAPRAKILQKRIFMYDKTGRDTSEDRHAYIPERPGGESAPVRDEHLDESMEALNGFKDEIMDAPRAKILQKRIFMYDKTGRDTSEDRHAYIPEREGSEISDDRASDLKKLLSLRDRVRDFHAKIDRFISKYQSNDEEQENSMSGKQLNSAQLRQWEKILNGFDTD